jgi:hypothetical protein
MGAVAEDRTRKHAEAVRSLAEQLDVLAYYISRWAVHGGEPTAEDHAAANTALGAAREMHQGLGVLLSRLASEIQADIAAVKAGRNA